MVWTLAFSIQHEVEKYGAYVAVASFLGLALLSILYFAQAREVRRLRDWAGRAPERDAELEARVTSQAARRAQSAPRPAPAAAAAEAQPTRVTPPAAAPAAAPVANGRAKSPLSVPMGPRPATAAAAIAAATAAAASAVPAAKPAEAEGDDEAETQAQPQGAVATDEVPAVAPVAPGGDDHDEDDDDYETGEEDAVAPAGGNGSGRAAAIPRATPRPAPRPAQPLRSGAGARSTSVPPRRITGRPSGAAPVDTDEGGNRRGIILGVLAGVVVLAVAAILIVTLTGSSTPKKTAPNTTAPVSTGTPGSSTPSGPSRAQTEVVILNGTTTDGLAAKAKTTLTGVGYAADKVPTSTDPNQATPTSTVYYASGRRRQALAVGRALHISRVSAIDPDTQTLADNSSNPPVKSDVVVVLGADQTP